MARRSTRRNTAAQIAIVAGVLGFGVTAAQAATPIDTGAPFYLWSNVGGTVLPDFQGGTLRLDVNAVTDANAYTVENFPTNTIDEFGNTVTFTNTFSGGGPLTFTDSGGGGKAIFTGTSILGGAVTISSGATLQWGNATGGAFLIGPGNAVVDNGALIMDFGGASGVSGSIPISGTGSLEVKSGLFDELGAATYTGTTTVDAAGTLTLGNGGSSVGTLAGAIVDNGLVKFDYAGAGPVTAANTFSGSGSVEMVSGTTVLTSSGIVSGTVTIDSGATMQWGNGTGGVFLVGGGNVVTDNGALVMDFGGSGIVGSVPISGTGTLEVKSGQFEETGAITIAGTTTIDAGAKLQLGDGTGVTGTVSGAITDNGLLEFDYNGPVTISNSIGGSGNVEVVAGTAIETGTGIVGGTVTIDSGATLQWGNGAGAAFLIGGGLGVVDNGALVMDFGGGGGVTGAIPISGTGTLEVKTGLFEDFGAITIAGTTTIDVGAKLQLATSGSTNGTVTGNITDNGLLKFSYTGAPVTEGSAISGSGNVEVATGTTVVTGSSFVGGAVTIDPGATMQWGNGGPAFLVGGGNSVIDNGALVMNFGGGGIAGAIPISGTGTVELQSGSLNESGISTYTGSTTIDAAGFLLLTSTGSIANSAFVLDNGTFDISGTTAGASITTLVGSGGVSLGGKTLTLTNAGSIFSGVIADGGLFGGTGGSLTIASGLLVLTGTNTFTGTTTINPGVILQLGAGGTTGSVAGAIVDNGSLLFNYGGPVTVGSAISGSGNAEAVAGTVVVTGSSFVGGTVTIDPGATMQWGNGGPAFLVGGGNSVIDNGALVMNFGGGGIAGAIPISGTGTVELQSGSLNESGISTYTGSTTIDAAGFLLLTSTGSIANSAFVLDNGTFDISGITAATAITTLVGSGGVSLGAQTLTLTAAAGTFSGVLADGGLFGGTGGGLTIAGGSQTLTGTNTLTGTTTINPGVILQLGAGGTTGTVAGPITDNGLLEFVYGGPVTINSLITGSGSAEIVAGTTIITTASFIGGTVTIDNGATLQWGNGAPAFLTGGGNAVVDNGALVLNFGGGGVGSTIPISGSGTFTLQSGAFTNGGVSTYTGSTTINAGNAILLLTGTGSIANSSGVVDNGTFDISGTTAGTSIKSLTGSGGVSLGARTLTITAATGTFSGVLADGGLFGGTGGGLTIAGGTETLTGANTYTGTTSVFGGTLAAGAANTFSPNSMLVVLAPANVTLNGFSQTVAGISGTGNVALGSATLTTNTAITRNLVGVISGSGGLTKGGTGIQILSGVNTYTGPTAITAGTLQMGIANALSASTDVTVASGATFALNSFNQTIGSLAGAGNVTLGSATLTTNGDNATTTFSGAISGTGGLTKAGTGTLFLTGVSTYTGVTLVNGGVLSVNGSIVSAVTANSGGTLKGTGTVGGVNAVSGGTVAPGNSIGTLHVAGNVSFGAGSTYQVEVNAAGQSDLIAATGTATLSGGIVQVLAAPGAYAPSTTYTILTASSVTGTFAGVTAANSFFLPSLTYKPAEVDLTLASAATLAQTPNQIAVANAIQANPGVLGAAIGALPVGQIPAAFDATSGEIHASVRSALLEDGQTLRNTVLTRLQDAQGGGIWGRLFGTWGGIDSDGNAARLDTNFSGLTVGADTTFGSSGVRGGVEAGYGQVQSFIGGARSSSLGSDSFHAGVYGGYGDGPFSLNGGVIGSWGTVRTVRAVGFGSFSDTDRANQSSRTAQAFAEAAYDVPLDNVDLTPFINGGWFEASTGAFTESGGAAALSGTHAVSDETFMTLGARLSTDIALPDGGDIAPNASVGWQHGFRGLTPARSLAFISSGAGFTVLGVPLDQDEAVIDAGVTAHPGPGATITFGYEGIFSERVTDNGLHLGVAWDF